MTQEASMESKRRDWREAYPVGSEVDLSLFSAGRRTRVTAHAGPYGGTRPGLMLADGGFFAAGTDQGEKFCAIEKYIRPLPPAEKREPRVGDVWRYTGPSGWTEWRIVTGADGRGSWECVTASGDVGWRPGSRSTGGGWDTSRPEWTLVTPAPAAQPSTVTINITGPMIAASPKSAPLCPCCHDTPLRFVGAEGERVFRCVNCHWTGSAERLAATREPARTEPKYGVGQRVNYIAPDMFDRTQVMAARWTAGGWEYDCVTLTEMHDEAMREERHTYKECELERVVGEAPAPPRRGP